MEIIGYIIFVWAFTQSIWLSFRWLNRTVNPPRRVFHFILADPLEFREIAEKEIMNLLNRIACEEIQAIEDAKVFQALTVNVERNFDNVTE